MPARCYPNGVCVGMCAGTLVFVSLILGFVATFSCHMMELTDIDTNTEIGVGLFGHEDTVNKNTFDCIAYTKDDKDELFDANWRSARTMGALMVVFAIILTIVMFVIICCGLSKKGAIALGVFSCLTSLLAFLELLVFNSNICDTNDCKFGYSGVVAIVTGILFLFATIPICMFRGIETKPRAKEEKKNKDPDEENQKDEAVGEENKEEGFEDEPATKETPEIELTEGERK